MKFVCWCYISENNFFSKDSQNSLFSDFDKWVRFPRGLESCFFFDTIFPDIFYKLSFYQQLHVNPV